jgi:RNA polymerase sigma factor (TIGR02999 family)
MATPPARHVLPAVALDGSSPAELLSRFYAELRLLARSRLAGGGRFTLLDTTALVHESFLKLQRGGLIEVDDSEHFFAYAAATMRSVIVDYIRQRRAGRRGGGVRNVTLDTALEPAASGEDEIIDIHEALEVLAAVDTRLVKVVEMRYFGGLTDAEVGTALGVTDRTVRRDWERARMLLAGMLGR